jgi:predicted nucleotidyltransferase component of viral defense system
MRLSNGQTEMLLEASIGAYESAISQYIKVDGSSLTITTLSPTELLVRKIEAYEGRRYVRDVYDIMHLTNYLKKNDYRVASKLRPFLKNIQKPVDERILRSLIYKGDKKITFEKMVAYLKRWSDEV